MGANIGTEPTPVVPALTIAAADDKGALAENGTVDAPVEVLSDLIINLEADCVADYTLTVNGEAVKLNGNSYTVALEEDVVTEIAITATAKHVATVSTYPDGITTETATFYVVKNTPEYLYGDTDLDGNVTVLDATLIQQYCALLEELSATSMLTADANGNGTISVMDATHIQRYAADLTCSAKVGTVIE